MSPTATVFLHARGELLALRGSEYFGRVGKGLRNAPGRLLGELEMLGAERLDRPPVDTVLREQLERFPARLAYPLAKRQQVFGRLLHDRRELLLLLLGGVDLDRDARAVRVDGETRSLTAYQFALLLALAEN